MSNMKYTGVAFAGLGPRSGKDTTKDELAHHRNLQKVSFADTLKQIASGMCNFLIDLNHDTPTLPLSDQLLITFAKQIFPEDIYGKEFTGNTPEEQDFIQELRELMTKLRYELMENEETHIDLLREEDKLKYRWLLQDLGTNLARKVDIDIWVKHAVRKIKQLNQEGHFPAVCDARFKNELFAMKDAGMLTVLLYADFETLINRGATPANLVHPVERGMDAHIEDFDIILDSRKHTQTEMAEDINNYLNGTPITKLKTLYTGPKTAPTPLPEMEKLTKQ